MSAPDIDAIRRRLAAVAAIDWTRVEHRKEDEVYGDWVVVGPVRMLTGDPECEPAHQRERAREEKAQQDAVVEFLTHAAGGIRALLDSVNHAGLEADGAAR